ncbi:MAG TPA: DUF2752 domain-containing protein [Actinomycetota bacterium]|nr:DUF2752 domain-containing protein [Actinomycetota bacterium]
MLFVFDPARSALFPPCPFKLATGLDCPGCGTLRGLHEMLRGNPATAFGLNPVSMAVLLLAAGFVVWSASRIVRGRPRLRVSPPAWAPWAAGALIVAYGVARNLPFAPLSWMASG